LPGSGNNIGRKKGRLFRREQAAEQVYNEKESLIMNSFMKGVTFGVVVGAAVATVAMPHRSKKNFKSSAGRAIRTVGNVVDSISNMVNT